ncbi:MAG: Hsp20/alpha crystallin family protein [Candidatus Bathyarchaeota archaeon]|nr:MAG: Hsp20/alpha crystallin family protein [Candidatus Bathyarchaeota archaeon]UCE58083.1 MAG: Hsp20/alpha crystallin family protein [Candidatus Bathyarchaeota archaeon]
MEEMMQREFEELSKRTPEDLVQERTLPDGTKVKRWGPFVYGYSMTIGPDGKPKVREFGNIKADTRLGRSQVDIREQREPLVDVMETDGEVKIIAELPGVEKKDVKLHGTENTLTISVDTSQRKYYKDVKMPTKIDPKKAKSNYKNGVLEITIPKTKKEKPKGEPITIE